MSAAEADDRHVVVFPWPEQSHINPAMEIAHCMAAAGILVTFVHTERTYSFLQAAATLHQVANLTVEVVPDDSMLSDHAATQQGLDLLLSRLMQSHPRPSCLLVDPFFPWAFSLANRHGLPRAELWIASAYAFTIGLHIPDLIAKGYLPITGPDCLERVVDFIPGLSPFRMSDLPCIFTVSDLEDPLFKFFTSVVQHSRDADRVLAHTVYEVERSTIDSLKENAGICMDPFGPLLTAPRHSLFLENPSCMSWLDKQEKGSVLYVAFGSVSAVKEEVFVELAYGLAASEQPFLWAIRPNTTSNAAEKPEESKLDEALNVLRKKGKGYITTWVPQLAVLGHPSVGGFLSHCGWNSTMEGLNQGLPILGLPIAGEQQINWKCIGNDWKVGIPLQEKGKEKGFLHRDRVETAVRAMMSGEEGRQARERALAWSKLAHKALHGSSRRNIERFIDDIKQGHLKMTKGR